MVSKVISRVISTLNGDTPIITLLIKDLLSPVPLQVRVPLRASVLKVLVRAPLLDPNGWPQISEHPIPLNEGIC